MCIYGRARRETNTQLGSMCTQCDKRVEDECVRFYILAVARRTLHQYRVRIYPRNPAAKINRIIIYNQLHDVIVIILSSMQYTHMTFELLLAKYTNNLQLCGKFSMPNYTAGSTQLFQVNNILKTSQSLVNAHLKYTLIGL